MALRCAVEAVLVGLAGEREGGRPPVVAVGVDRLELDCILHLGDELLGRGQRVLVDDDVPQSIKLLR